MLRIMTVSLSSMEDVSYINILSNQSAKNPIAKKSSRLYSIKHIRINITGITMYFRYFQYLRINFITHSPYCFYEFWFSWRFSELFSQSGNMSHNRIVVIKVFLTPNSFK